MNILVAVILCAGFVVSAVPPVCARGGGGCIEQATAILTPCGPMPIEKLSAGDAVFSMIEGRPMIAHVAGSTRVDPSIYIEIETARHTIRATPEHPFAIAAGVYKIADHIRAGDPVLLGNAGGVITTTVSRINRTESKRPAFNLLVNPGGNFLAGGFLVHNKGCFLPDTPILRADGRSVSIRDIHPGDDVLAFRDESTIVTTRVRAVLTATVDRYLVVTTDATILHVTPEHPFYIGNGVFKTMEALHAGDRIMALHERGLSDQYITGVKAVDGRTTVYNLQTDEPNTFFASGIAVHNKGGGGGGGGRSHSRSSHRSSSGGGSGKPPPPIVIIIFFGIFIFAFIAGAVNKRKPNASEDLDYCYPRTAIDKKALKTGKLLAFIARQDQAMVAETLVATARATFLKLQECWQSRDYGPMQALLFPDLYRQHLKQIDGMKRNHEINKMGDLQVLAIDLVNLRYTNKTNSREFTALFTARMRDYYIDERTNAVLRGDSAPSTFQEFWTFQLQDGAWRLRDVEQTRESDALKDENFFESFTDKQIEQIYGEKVEATGPTGPWLDVATGTKATKIERLLNFLYETDKLWNRQTMLERARNTFTDVYMARESGIITPELKNTLFPDVATDLSAFITSLRTKGDRVEYRNFCVRKVEIILVANMRDNTDDEYCVRITAHAQQAISRGNTTFVQDDYVMPFEEFWVFGRLDKQWKLKQVLPPAAGESALTHENIDEDSSPDQVQWYYSKKRTV